MRQFDEAGYDIDRYGRLGRDADGYDRDGFRENGFNRNLQTRAEVYRPEVVSHTDEANGDRTTAYRCDWRGPNYRETIRRDQMGREVYAENTDGLRMWTTYNASGAAEYHDTNPSA